MTKKITISVLAFVVIAAAGAIFVVNRRSEVASPAPRPLVAGEQTESSSEGDRVKVFTVDGTNFAFNPAKIEVNKGETIKIIFKNNEGNHNLMIDGYNVSTQVVGEGSEAPVQFVADKTGTFEYYCSVGNHRELGMTGVLVVK